MNNTNEFVKFNQQDFDIFKGDYYVAVMNKQESFMFKEKEFLTTFAKYVIEYLETKFKTHKP